MATSYIGKPIALLSHSDVRYRGILAGLDPSNSTIQLQNVYSMGTENRRPPEEYIPPAEQPYQYIIFRASEVKDLALDTAVEIARSRSVHDDPAVIGASAPPAQPAYGQSQTDGQYSQDATDRRPSQPAATVPPQGTSTAKVPVKNVPANGVPEQPQAQLAQLQQQQQGDAGAGHASGINRRANASVNSVHSAAQSLENVERAMSDLRLQSTHTNGRGGRRGGGAREQRPAHAPITIPLTEFDFATANARFKKSKGSGRKNGAEGADDEEDSDAKTNPSDEEDAESKASSGKVAKDSASPVAYNPKSSFFDSLSSSAAGPVNGAPAVRGGGGGRRGMGRSRREEERERNVATFGEPGGVGLMGPDAYVGGYGRGRRGGPRGGRRGGLRRGAAVVAGQ